MSRFEKRSEKIDGKKAQLTRENMNLLCLNNANMSKKEYKKILEAYAKKVAKLELNKYGVHRAVTFREINTPRVYGSLSYGKGLRFYKEGNKYKIGMGSILSINYDTVIKSLRSDDLTTRTTGYTKFIETVHHEVWHKLQHIVAENKKKIKEIPKEYAFKYAMEFVAIEEDRANYYKKGDNYRKMLIEQSAREKGITSTMDILNKSYKKSFIRKIFNNQKISDVLEDSYVELENLEGSEGIRNRFSVTSDIVDKAIKRNLKYLKRMPILQEAYTLDGNRKPIYQVIRQNAKATRKLQMNPFIPQKAKRQKIQEVQDLYSEIFTETLKQCDEDDLIFAKKVVGNKTFRSMIDISRDHYSRKYNEVEKNAKDEASIREHISGTTRLNRSIYKERMENNLNRYGPYVNFLNEVDEVMRKVKVEKMSPSQVKEQLKNDEKKVKANIRKRKNRTHTTNTRTKARYGDFAIADEQLDVNLDEMRDLKEGYEELRDINMVNLEQTKEQYYAKLDQTKLKEIDMNTKEK
ncbi:MAG: hypothetical protein J6A15_04605 [Clostridia bacterium]|nr:hypothetical protein [Clostridia bacterium]